MKSILRWTAPAALLLALGACQTLPPDNAHLQAARQAVDQARAHPMSARAAGAELDRSQQALQRAESAWSERHDAEETQHLAYLAQRRAAITLALAEQAKAEERIQQAGTERERLRLEARTREAAAAQREAAASQRDAASARSEANDQAQRAAALERDLQSLSARNTQRGLVVTLGDVLFATGKADLQPGTQRHVQQLAQVLEQHPERRILVEGHTDNRGGTERNMALSQRRAEAFRNALVQAGVGAERIEVRAHGEAQPVADNGNAAGRQRNRRVEVLFSDGNGRFAGGG